MTSPPFAQMRCPFCKGIVRPGDSTCKWCLSLLRPGSTKQVVKPERTPVTWSKSDVSYAEHLAWKTSLSPGDPVMVQDGETAAQRVDGELQATMLYGTTLVTALPLNDASARRIEVLFAKTAAQSFKWGEGDLSTSDGINVMAHGTINVRQVDPAKLVGLFPPGHAYLSLKDLKGPVFHLIKSVLESILVQMIASQVMSNVKTLEETAGRQLVSQLGNFGLEVSEFDIKNLSLSEEYRRAVERQGIRSLEAQSEMAKLEQLKKVGVDVNKFATMERVAEKATGLHLVAGDFVAGDYVAGSAIRDSVVLRSNFGTSGKVEDAVVTGEIAAQCPSCNTTLNALIHKFCYHCGTRIRACSKCRVVVPHPGKFCYECGEPIS